MRLASLFQTLPYFLYEISSLEIVSEENFNETKEQIFNQWNSETNSKSDTK